MVPFMKGNGKVIRRTGMGSKYGRMGLSMKESGRITEHRGKASFTTLMKIFMRVSGWRIRVILMYIINK
jgi:hypothetical protein